MRGHKAIIEMRLDGYKPDCCFVTLLDRPIRIRWGWDDPELSMANGSFADVVIEPDDLVQTLDLRFLLAMRVIVTDVQGNVQRTQALLERAVQFAPEMVIATSFADSGNLFIRYTPQGGFEDLNVQPQATPAAAVCQGPVSALAQPVAQDDFAFLGGV